MSASASYNESSKVSPLLPIKLVPFGESTRQFTRVDRSLFEINVQDDRAVAHSMVTSYSKKLKTTECSAFRRKDCTSRKGPMRPKLTVNTLACQSERNGAWKLDVSDSSDRNLGGVGSFLARTSAAVPCIRSPGVLPPPAPPLPVLPMSPTAIDRLDSEENSNQKRPSTSHSVSVLLPHLPSSAFNAISKDDNETPKILSPGKNKRQSLKQSDQNLESTGSLKIRIEIPKV